jgi:Spy/CpxP family protein refolding chaperone
MNYFNKKNVVILIIAVLLIINIATISTIVYLTYHKPTMPPYAEKFHTESFRKNWGKLGLNKKQKEAFGNFKRKYRVQTREIFKELHKKRVLMMDEFSNKESDSIVLYKLAEESGNLHEKLKIITLNHLLDLKNVCTPEQFKYLEGLFRMKIMEDEPNGKPYHWKKRKWKSNKNNNKNQKSNH